MDEDGFQQVKSRKNTKRNIFNIVNDEMRSSAFALAEETKAARNKSKSLKGEASQGQRGHTVNEPPLQAPGGAGTKHTPN